MLHKRIKHLVLDIAPEPLNYYAGINSGDVYLEPDEEVHFFSVILREGQYSQFGSIYSAVGAIAQMEDGRIFGGEVMSSHVAESSDLLSGELTLKLKMEVIPKPVS